MTTRKPRTKSAPAHERPVRQRPETRPQRAADRYVLRLYVAGVSRASAHAVERVRTLCEEHLRGSYELEVIDIYQLPALARGEQIVATPTLVRVLPEPLRRYIGNLSNEKIILGFDVREKT